VNSIFRHFSPDSPAPTLRQSEPADDPVVRLGTTKPKEKIQRPIPKTAQAAGTNLINLFTAVIYKSE